VNLYTTDIVSLLHVLVTYCGHLLAGVFEGYITKKHKNVVFYLLGDSPECEFYVPTFRNTMFQVRRWCMQEE